MKSTQNVLKFELRAFAPAFGSIFLFSLFTTLLSLVPTVFMMQLSERVLGSRSELTLVFLIVASSLRVDFTAAIQNCPGILVGRWTRNSQCFGSIAKNLQRLPAA